MKGIHCNRKIYPKKYPFTLTYATHNDTAYAQFWGCYIECKNARIFSTYDVTGDFTNKKKRLSMIKEFQISR